jgi:probable HAF family extracellular repeat protein
MSSNHQDIEWSKCRKAAGRRVGAAATLCLAALALPASATGPTRYIGYIALAPDGQALSAVAINDEGVIAGSVFQGFPRDEWDTFAGRPPAHYRTWRVHGSLESSATAIDVRGDVAGWYTEQVGRLMVRHGYYKARDGEVVDLFPNSRGTRLSSQPTAMNGAGLVVGDFYVSSRPPLKAFAWRDGRSVELGTLGGSGSRVYGLNEAGVAVGDADLPGDAVTHAYAWHAGTMTDLGAIDPSGSSYAAGINANGWIAGASAVGHGATHACLWHDGRIVDLGAIAGHQSGISAINDQGIAVGNSTYDDSGLTTAALWHDGIVEDLNDITDLPPDTHLDIAYAIDNAGEILAQGRTAGIYYDYLLVPRARR